MGFRFQRRIKIAPGLRLNVSTGGLGISAGVPGARASMGPRGLWKTVGIPGTGLSYTSSSRPKTTAPKTGGKRGRAHAQATAETPPVIHVGPEEKARLAVAVARTPEKSPLLAACLSVVICGAGQWYCGQRGRALLYLLGWVLLIPWPFAVVNAWRSARDYNVALAEARRFVAEEIA